MAKIVAVGDCCRCGKPMNDPRILPCGHSFCLKCLEFLTSSTCSRCRLSFKMPACGPKGLKKNKFVECLLSHSKKSPPCDICNQNVAIKFCTNCCKNYCVACLLSHQKVPSSKKHKWRKLDLPQNKNKVEYDYSRCEEHLDVVNLYCIKCKTSLCGRCLVAKHIDHKIIPFLDYFQSVKHQLEQNLKDKKVHLSRIIGNCKTAKNMMEDGEKRAASMKKQIDENSNLMKISIDEIVKQLKASIDEGLEDYAREAADTIEKLRLAESKLSIEIEVVQRRLNELNFKNVPEAFDLPGGSLVEDEVVSHSKTFYLELLPVVNDRMETLKELIGTLRKEPGCCIVKENKLSERVKSLAFNQKNIFISRWHNSKIQVLHSVDMSENLKLDLGKFVSEIHDMLMIEEDDNLFVVGKLSRSYCRDVVKVVKCCSRDFVLEEICSFSCQGNTFKLSRSSHDANILLVVEDELLLLNQDGKIVKTTRMPYKTYDAIQVGRDAYVICCSEGLLLVGGDGKEVGAYAPLNDAQEMKSPSCLERDRRGFLYVADNYHEGRKIFVLDPELGFMCSVGVDVFLNEIRYDERTHSLLALTRHSLVEIRL